MNLIFNQILKIFASKKVLKFYCGAPFNNIYFRINGDVTPCSANTENTFGRYPNHSVKELFEGKLRMELSKKLADNQPLSGCYKCKEKLSCGNNKSATFQLYNKCFSRTRIPVTAEFELSNNCNLKCIMCNSLLSDKHEGVKKIINNVVYDVSFVDQLIPYYKYLKRASFKGGEPFLIDLYYQIWENIVKVNNNIIISVTSNGTVLNDKVRDILSRGKFDINISIDSLNKNRFELIRENASYTKFRQNLDYFIKYCKLKSTNFNSCSCIMTKNYQDIPEIFRLADKNNFNVFINFVEEPHNLSLKYLPKKDIAEIITFYEKNKPSFNIFSGRRNSIVYNSLIKQLKTWQEDKSNEYINLTEQNSKMVFDEKTQAIVKKIQKNIAISYNIYLNIEENEIYKQQIAKIKGAYNKSLKNLSSDQIIDSLLSFDDQFFNKIFGLTEDQLVNLLKDKCNPNLIISSHEANIIHTKNK
jgi:MoaA/NifB/PqqE/SkfB family radical SAM enzyme